MSAELNAAGLLTISQPSTCLEMGVMLTVISLQTWAERNLCSLSLGMPHSTQLRGGRPWQRILPAFLLPWRKVQSLSGNLGVWWGGDGRKKPTWVKVTIWAHGNICYSANNNEPGTVSEEGALPQPVKMWQPPAPSTHMQSCDRLYLWPSPILAAVLP